MSYVVSMRERGLPRVISDTRPGERGVWAVELESVTEGGEGREGQEGGGRVDWSARR